MKCREVVGSSPTGLLNMNGVRSSIRAPGLISDAQPSGLAETQRRWWLRRREPKATHFEFSGPS